jgi:hypothetical protein
MAKNNQKKEKALRNLENARKYRKKSTDKRRRFAGPRPAAASAGAGSPQPFAQPASQPQAIAKPAAPEA